MMYFRSKHARLSALLALAALLTAFAAQAVTLRDLYETAQPVGVSREAAFEEALRVVVVRVSGRRDAPQRLGAELANPREYVQRFGFTEDNVLQVGFDSVSIDNLLTGAGLPIWGRERPATLVVLGLEDAAGVRWLSSDVPAAEREAVERTAYERGLPLVWPSMDGDDRALADAGLAASQESWLDVARRYGAHAALIGRMRDGSVRWTLISNDAVEQTVGDLAEGVHLAADAFARVYAASGGSLSSVALEVAGVVDLNAYASVVNYLESITLVRSVSVEQVAGDVLRLKLAVRGDADTLERAIALDNRLLPLGSSGTNASTAGERLSFRYNR
jgi:hypothetical protein